VASAPSVRAGQPDVRRCVDLVLVYSRECRTAYVEVTRKTSSTVVTPSRIFWRPSSRSVRVPMEFKVRGGRKEIILPADAETEPKARPHRPLVVALARAHRWQRMLDAGEPASLDELALQYGVDRSYVGRLVRLSSLAPRIVEMALTGKEPTGRSLDWLASSLPAEWTEQAKLLGLLGL